MNNLLYADCPKNLKQTPNNLLQSGFESCPVNLMAKLVEIARFMLIHATTCRTLPKGVEVPVNPL